MNFHQLRITTRLWVFVGFIIATQLAVVIYAAWRSANVTARSEAVMQPVEAKQQAAARWSALLATNIARVQATAVGSDAEVEALFKPLIASTIEEISRVQKSIEALPLTTADQALMARIASERKAVLDSLARVRTSKAAGDTDAARTEALKVFNPATEVYLASLREFVTLQDTQATALKQGFIAERQFTIKVAALGVLFILLALVSGALWLGRSIQRPLAAAIHAAERIAQGDLTAEIAVDRADEFGDLARALQGMNRSLAGLIGQVRLATDSIGTASSEIATGNVDLSSRTEQTASNLQQAASSMEQLTGTVSQTAESARSANTLAATAATVAARGGEVVAQVVTTMQDINHSSKKISDIIGTIDGIAFQTNILALNAAVEAARAGEQGRGFAVVASEVRSLAQRSAEAAKEIKSLIGSSVEKVESGTRLVADAGSTMTEIVASVQRVNDIISEISAAAAEQSNGLGQVNGAVADLDRMTQQNAALVEESAAAAESLKDQAGRLGGLVATFRLRAA